MVLETRTMHYMQAKGVKLHFVLFTICGSFDKDFPVALRKRITASKCLCFGDFQLTR